MSPFKMRSKLKLLSEACSNAVTGHGSSIQKHRAFVSIPRVCKKEKKGVYPGKEGVSDSVQSSSGSWFLSVALMPTPMQ